MDQLPLDAAFFRAGGAAEPAVVYRFIRVEKASHNGGRTPVAVGCPLDPVKTGASWARL